MVLVKFFSKNVQNIVENLLFLKKICFIKLPLEKDLLFGQEIQFLHFDLEPWFNNSIGWSGFGQRNNSSTNNILLFSAKLEKLRNLSCSAVWAEMNKAGRWTIFFFNGLTNMQKCWTDGKKGRKIGPPSKGMEICL